MSSRQCGNNWCCLQQLVESENFLCCAESLVEAALCKSVLKPLKEPIYRSLERLHTESRRQLEKNQVGQSIHTPTEPAQRM